RSTFQRRNRHTDCPENDIAQIGKETPFQATQSQKSHPQKKALNQEVPPSISIASSSFPSVWIPNATLTIKKILGVFFKTG
ncbi:MAG: hypothetical protein MI742_00690, partial [Desulfobacterales bacterium]|nr:hypothetical protein [Desulfobacterales bacterium]